MSEPSSVDRPATLFAHRHLRALRLPALVAPGLAAALLAASWWWSPATPLRALALALLLAAVHTCVVWWRTRCRASLDAAVAADPLAPVATELRRLRRAVRWPAQLPVLCVGLLAAIVLWRPVLSADAATAHAWLGAICCGAAFPLLVWQRFLACRDADGLPEGPGLAGIAWLPVLTALATGLLLVADGLGWRPQWGERDVAPVLLAMLHGFVGLIVLEQVLRAGLAAALPGGSDRPALLPGSVLGRWERRRDASTGTGLEQALGLDLGGSWILRWLRRWALAALIAVVGLAWSTTAITTLGPAERGIYERFGEPVAVWQPGVHLHLPWPAGRVHRGPYGSIEAVPVGGELPLAATVRPTEPVTLPVLEGPVERDSVAADDRLWDADHPNEFYVLTATPPRAEGGADRMALLNVDLTVRFRVGLGDEDLLRATYNVDDCHALVRSRARRLLQRLAASRTLPTLLAADRGELVLGLQRRLQTQLDELGTGLEIIDCTAEALHPPLDVAPAFFEAQAAELAGRTAVDHARGMAANMRGRARIDALRLLRKAEGEAGEWLAAARAEVVGFAADVEAEAIDPDWFRFERRLQAAAASWSDRPVTIIDARLPAAEAHDLDLRGGVPVPVLTE